MDSTIAYGKFIQALFIFIMVAFVLFVVVKAMNKMKRAEEAKPAKEAVVSDDIKLLMEIRDLLKK